MYGGFRAFLRPKKQYATQYPIRYALHFLTKKHVSREVLNKVIKVRF
jgi:hypothetical protein